MKEKSREVVGWIVVVVVFAFLVWAVVYIRNNP